MCRGAKGLGAPVTSLEDLGNSTSSHGAATFADCEAKAVLHGDGLNQSDLHFGVVTWHDHLFTGWQVHNTGHVSGPEVELRAVVVEERSVSTTLILRQDVDRGFELGVRRNRARLTKDLATLNVFTLGSTQQNANVFTSLTFVEQLAEHLDSGYGGLLDLVANTNDFNFFVDLDDSTLDTTGDNGSTTSDREDVLNGHQEGLVNIALRSGD